MSESFADELPSLYSVNAIEVPERPGNPNPYPPGTVYTASVETIDNHRAGPRRRDPRITYQQRSCN